MKNELYMREQLQMIKDKMNVSVEDVGVEKVEKGAEVKMVDKIVERVENKETKKPIREVRRCELWYADLGSNRKGSLQFGVRPIIVVSNSLNNRYCSNVNILAITSRLDKTSLPVHTNISGFGLRQESVVLAETIESIDKSQLLSYIGTVDEVTMKRIELAIKIQLSELKPKTNFERLSSEKQSFVIEKLNIIKECETVLRFLNRIKGIKQDIDIAEDEKFEAENSLMSFCYENNLNCESFYSKENGINKEIAL